MRNDATERDGKKKKRDGKKEKREMERTERRENETTERKEDRNRKKREKEKKEKGKPVVIVNIYNMESSATQPHLLVLVGNVVSSPCKDVKGRMILCAGE